MRVQVEHVMVVAQAELRQLQNRSFAQKEHALPQFYLRLNSSYDNALPIQQHLYLMLTPIRLIINHCGAIERMLVQAQ